MVLLLLNQRPHLKAQIQKSETGATPVLLPNIFAGCVAFPGARTALSACCSRAGRDSRTRLSALLWLWFRCTLLCAFFAATLRRLLGLSGNLGQGPDAPAGPGQFGRVNGWKFCRLPTGDTADSQFALLQAQ